jgi:DNA-binding XRE family transcriptional regulator
MLNKMTPAQCRSARALLEMTQPELARAADLGLSTIVDFEKVRRQVPNDTILAMKNALELAGIEFIAENGGGPGVRLRKRQRRKMPKD